VLVEGNNTVSITDVSALTKLSFLQNSKFTFTTGVVNSILASFWANRAITKIDNNRNIDVRGSVSSGAPSGQGIIDKAALQAYASPIGATLWTVLTR